VREIAASLPWLVPGIIAALVISIVASRRVGAWLRIHWLLAALLVFSLGVILVGTLTPLAADMVLPPEARDTCDLSRTWLATPIDLASGDDVLVNILMFMPFGFAIGTIPWTWRKIAVILAAIALPFLIEGLQLTVLQLGRGCQAADVVDNLTGLFIGFFAGIPTTWWPSPRRRG
jgi:glycopeptide antibiotics resistance protein